MEEYIKDLSCLNRYYGKREIAYYPKEHPFYQQKKTFFIELDRMFSTIEEFFDDGKKVCRDYVKKLVAKKGKVFDINVFNAYFTEFLTVYLFSSNSLFENSLGLYEPQRVNDSTKNPEFAIVGAHKEINVEVKTLNFTDTFYKVIEETFKRKVYIFKEYLPLGDDERQKVRSKIMRENKLDIDKMVYYKSEYRKINKNLKNANSKFKDINYNIVIVNYNGGIGFDEPVKCILDEVNGILEKTNNMSNIDAIIITALSDKCYSLVDYNHFFENTFVIYNYKRGNRDLIEILEKVGYKNFVSADEVVNNEWEIFQIIVFDVIPNKSNYIVVPINRDSKQEVINALDFIASKEIQNTKNYKETLEGLYDNLRESEWH